MRRLLAILTYLQYLGAAQAKDGLNFISSLQTRNNRENFGKIASLVDLVRFLTQASGASSTYTQAAYLAGLMSQYAGEIIEDGALGGRIAACFDLIPSGDAAIDKYSVAMRAIQQNDETARSELVSALNGGVDFQVTVNGITYAQWATAQGLNADPAEGTPGEHLAYMISGGLRYGPPA